MSVKLRSYVVSRIINNGKRCIDLISEISPKNTNSSKNVSLFLPVNQINKYNLNTNNIKNLNSDNIISSVKYVQNNPNDFITFEINKNVFIQDVLDNYKEKIYTSKNENVIVEYSSPNIAKPFHLGHLRSTIIGNFISNINEYFGNKVTRLNYLGDWGTQFGFLNIGIDLMKLTNEQIKENPIQLLYEAYVSANKLGEIDPSINQKARDVFLRLENGDKKDIERWKSIKEYTVNELERVYNRIGVKFNQYNWESMYGVEDIKKIIDLLKNSDLLKTDDKNRKVVNANDRIIPVMKSDNTSLYITRDIAAAIDRYEKFKFDRMIYVVDNAQSDHFVALKDIMKQLGFEWANGLTHVKFGRVRGMSTRKGNTVFLNDILNEAKDLMRIKQIESATTKLSDNEIGNDITDTLGISCVIINDLKQRRTKDYNFDWNKILQVQGDTGVKLQYTHCRLLSLEQNCGVDLPSICHPELLSESPQALALILHLSRFQDELLKSYNDMEACILVNYLFMLCNYTNKAFKTLQVKNQDPEVASQRLLMFHTARLILKQGMNILGLKPLEKM